MRNSHAASPDKPKAAACQDTAQDETDSRYERLDKLGEGTYGIVYKSRDRDTNEVSKMLSYERGQLALLLEASY